MITESGEERSVLFSQEQVESLGINVNNATVLSGYFVDPALAMVYYDGGRVPVIVADSTSDSTSPEKLFREEKRKLFREADILERDLLDRFLRHHRIPQEIWDAAKMDDGIEMKYLLHTEEDLIESLEQFTSVANQPTSVANQATKADQATEADLNQWRDKFAFSKIKDDNLETVNEIGVANLPSRFAVGAPWHPGKKIETFNYYSSYFAAQTKTTRTHPTITKTCYYVRPSALLRFWKVQEYTNNMLTALGSKIGKLLEKSHLFGAIDLYDNWTWRRTWLIDQLREKLNTILTKTNTTPNLVALDDAALDANLAEVRGFCIDHHVIVAINDRFWRLDPAYYGVPRSAHGTEPQSYPSFDKAGEDEMRDSLDIRNFMSRYPQRYTLVDEMHEHEKMRAVESVMEEIGKDWREWRDAVDKLQEGDTLYDALYRDFPTNLPAKYLFRLGEKEKQTLKADSPSQIYVEDIEMKWVRIVTRGEVSEFQNMVHAMSPYERLLTPTFLRDPCKFDDDDCGSLSCVLDFLCAIRQFGLTYKSNRSNLVAHVVNSLDRVLTPIYGDCTAFHILKCAISNYAKHVKPYNPRDSRLANDTNDKDIINIPNTKSFRWRIIKTTQYDSYWPVEDTTDDNSMIADEEKNFREWANSAGVGWLEKNEPFQAFQTIRNFTLLADKTTETLTRDLPPRPYDRTDPYRPMVRRRRGPDGSIEWTSGAIEGDFDSGFKHVEAWGGLFEQENEGGRR